MLLVFALFVLLVYRRLIVIMFPFLVVFHRLLIFFNFRVNQKHWLALLFMVLIKIASKMIHKQFLCALNLFENFILFGSKFQSIIIIKSVIVSITQTRVLLLKIGRKRHDWTWFLKLTWLVHSIVRSFMHT